MARPCGIVNPGRGRLLEFAGWPGRRRVVVCKLSRKVKLEVPGLEASPALLRGMQLGAAAGKVVADAPSGWRPVELRVVFVREASRSRRRKGER